MNAYDSIIGNIEDVQVARTTKAGKKIYAVTINGQVFDAFDASYQAKIGMDGEWRFKRGEYKGREQLTLVDLDRKPRPAEPDEKYKKLVSLLEEILYHVARIPHS